MAVTEGQLISDGTAVWKVKKIGSEVPAGTMQMFAGNTIPAGWLLCDGSAVSRTDYAKLFSAIGTIYGKGNGNTTFNLPNAIDRVVQGAATAGTYKAAGLPNIEGSINFSFVDGNYGLVNSNTVSSDVIGAFGINTTNLKHGLAGGSTKDRVGDVITFSADKSNSIYGSSTTVQPPALTMLPIIKY